MHHFANRGVITTSILLTLAVAGEPVHAQTFATLHTFTGGSDGAMPRVGLTLDARGNLYGTTFSGGDSNSNGIVFKLANIRGVWTLTPIYTFLGTYQGNTDGTGPSGRVIFGPNSTLFGTTQYGGDPQCGCAGPPFLCMGCGTVFNLKARTAVCSSVQCRWSETQLFQFGEPGAAGRYPTGDLLFDPAENIFGTARVVYELSQAGGGWTETVVNQFSGGSGGSEPDGLIFDGAGNLYGTSFLGGSMGCYSGDGCGVVFKLTPSSGSWIETVLYTFTGGNDGGNPTGLIFDQSGNLYGATYSYGTGGGGTVFELSPSSGGGWTYTVLYSFAGRNNCGPGPLTLRGGSVYGTTYCDGANTKGNVFKLTPSDGGWTYTSLHDFTGGSDGGYPVSNVIFDSAGNLYGTASGGGSGCGEGGCGVVWEIVP
jgi:uncharacterized repeat protein (TIGR03803 family)